MKPGRVKRWVRVDWFTLLFEFPRTELGAHQVVVSFNGATRLILGYKFFTQALHKLLVISIVSEPSLYPLEPNQDSKEAGFSFPLGPHFRDYLLGWRYPQATCVSGARQLVPSRSIAQQRTNSLLPTATIAIFLRDFLPPLIR